MRFLSSCVSRIVMLALFAGLLLLTYTVGQAIMARWAIVRGETSTRPAAQATAERPLFALVTPTRLPSPTATVRPTEAPTATPRPVAPALPTIQPQTTKQAKTGPFTHSGKIEKIDGRTWTINGQEIVIPFDVTGRPRVGADAEVEGIVRPDGVWEAKRVQFTP